MRIASPFIMIIHVIGSLREADVGQQSADTIKLNFRFRCPRRCARSKVGDQTTKVLAIYVVERGNRWQRRGRHFRPRKPQQLPRCRKPLHLTCRGKLNHNRKPRLSRRPNQRCHRCRGRRCPCARSGSFTPHRVGGLAKA